MGTEARTTVGVQAHGRTGQQLAADAAGRLRRGAGAASRVYRQVMGEGQLDPKALGLSAEASAQWLGQFRCDLPTVSRVVEEPGPRGTTAKAVLRLADGLEVECVRIAMGRGRSTLCISSQVGCKMGCTFCETARMGFIRQLSIDEIVGQWLVARTVLGWPVGNVVFMGMGEPLDNVDAVIGAVRVLNDPGGLAIAQERITICTVGRAEPIRRLAQERFTRLNLSVSLNATGDELRAKLMPVTRGTPLTELRRALMDYRPRRNFALGVHWCLMPGINDRREDAQGVARFCAGLGRVLVQVIPFNPGTGAITRAPTPAEIERFVGWLRAEGLAVRARIPKGRSVMAACGQLAT